MKFLLPLLLLLCFACKEEEVFIDTKLSSLNQLKLCFIGDTGLRPEPQFEVAQFLKAEKCHEIFFLGDLIYKSKIQTPLYEKIYKRFINIYRPLTTIDNKPLLNLIMGNHDYEGNPNVWLEVAKKHPFIYYPEKYYLKTFGNLCIFALDSNLWNGYGNMFEGIRQGQWLASLSKSFDQCAVKVALTHHPYVISGKHHGAQGWLKSIYEKAILGSIDILLSGHSHIVADKGEIQGTRQLISGGGGGAEKNKPPGYITLDVFLHQGKVQKVDYNLHLISDNKMQVQKKHLTLKQAKRSLADEKVSISKQSF